MLEHVNARAGVKDLYRAILISIIASFVALVSWVPVLGIVVMIAVGVLEFISYMFLIVGYNKAGKDSEQLKMAFNLTIIALIVSAVGWVGSFLGIPFLPPIIKLAGYIITLITLKFTIDGINDLLIKGKNVELAETGNTVWKMVLFIQIALIVVAIVSVIISVLTVAFPTAAFVLKIVTGIVYVVLAILEIVYEFKLLGFYKNSYPII